MASSAQLLVERLGRQGDVVVLRGIPTVIDDERIQGLTDVIEQPDIDILAIQHANRSQDDAFTLMQDRLAKSPRIDARPPPRLILAMRRLRLGPTCREGEVAPT